MYEVGWKNEIKVKQFNSQYHRVLLAYPDMTKRGGKESFH